MKKLIFTSIISGIILGGAIVGFAVGCGGEKDGEKEQGADVANAPSEAVTEEASLVVTESEAAAAAASSNADSAADDEVEDDGDKIVKKSAADVEDASLKEADAVEKSDDVESENVDDRALTMAGGNSELTPTIEESDEVMLNNIILARGVAKREAVEPGTTFSVSEGEKIYAILDVKNSTEEIAEITVSWKMPNSDKEIGEASFEINPAKTWRTWSFTRWAKKIGTWEAVVRNANDEIIARAPFEVTE